MNQGGAPKGKRAATLHKEQVQREIADPSLRDARVAEDKAKRRVFIDDLIAFTTVFYNSDAHQVDVVCKMFRE